MSESDDLLHKATETLASIDQPSQKAVLTTIQQAVPDLIAVYQFGSTVQGGEHAESDLGLALLARSALPNLDRWTLQEDLAAELGRDVDLIDLRAASTVMQAQVLGKGDGSRRSGPNRAAAVRDARLFRVRTAE